MNRIKNISWDQYFMTMVYLVSMKSKDPRTHIGAVIVGPDNEIRSTGYNGLPRGVDETPKSRQERPEKYYFYEHAERNAIYNAARMGLTTQDMIMYTQGIPCADCARGIIQSGIKEVVVHKAWEQHNKYLENQKWVESVERSNQMFYESGVTIRYFREDIITNIIGFSDGEII